ncbi:MAG: hypothetical protein KY396_05460 [Actinobacteria bacterium]|nr:hypothetical protein [Actinomycetota bacterium]
MSEAPTPEEQQRLAEEIAEQLAKLRVEDVIVNTLMTLSAIGYRHVGGGSEGGRERDLGQTRLAIETMRALTPLLEPRVPAELLRDFNQAIANLQLAYAQAIAQETTEDGDPPAS